MSGPDGHCYDPLRLQELPYLNVPQHQALWLQILEAVDEPQGSELQELAARPPGPEPIAVEIAARVRQRAINVLSQMDTRETLATVLGLNSAMQFIQQALQELIYDRVDYLDNAAESNNQAGAREESAEEEEEVQLEEAEETAMVQSGPGRMTRPNPTWEPLGQEDRANLERLLREILPQQADPEPTLFALAQLGASPPVLCQLGGEDEEEGEPSPRSVEAWFGAPAVDDAGGATATTDSHPARATRTTPCGWD